MFKLKLKLIVSFILLFVLCQTTLSFSQGDVTGNDDKVTIQDLNTIRDHVMQINTLQGRDLLLANVNCDYDQDDIPIINLQDLFDSVDGMIEGDLLRCPTFINNMPLTNDQIQDMTTILGNEPLPGKYWYDEVTGWLGWEGQGIMHTLPDSLSLENLGLTTSFSTFNPTESTGTGTYINGRELLPFEINYLRTALGLTISQERYCLDSLGYVGIDGDNSGCVFDELTYDDLITRIYGDEFTTPLILQYVYSYTSEDAQIISNIISGLRTKTVIGVVNNPEINTGFTQIGSNFVPVYFNLYSINGAQNSWGGSILRTGGNTQGECSYINIPGSMGVSSGFYSSPGC